LQAVAAILALHTDVAGEATQAHVRQLVSPAMEATWLTLRHVPLAPPLRQLVLHAHATFPRFNTGALFAFFRHLVTSPEKVANCFWPTMEDDAMADIRTAQGFTGRWMQCSNG
jgi:hypothetical protein